jgi:N6-L-threonylcarbamoyladenine synthase
VFILSYTVGVRKARRVAGNFSLPIVGVHHMEAHALVARYCLICSRYGFVPIF